MYYFPSSDDGVPGTGKNFGYKYEPYGYGHGRRAYGYDRYGYNGY
jgi:hypothetical protein